MAYLPPEVDSYMRKVRKHKRYDAVDVIAACLILRVKLRLMVRTSSGYRQLRLHPASHQSLPFTVANATRHNDPESDTAVFVFRLN